MLPVVAGPILLILYLEHGSHFAAHAARAATLGIVPLALFALVFGYLSKRHGWLVTLAVSWVAVLGADLALAQVDVPAGLALALALLALHGASALLRRLGQPAPAALPAPWWDLPARAVATALLVLLVTGLAARRGPRDDRYAHAFSDCVERGLRLHDSTGRSCRGSRSASRGRAGARRLRPVLFSRRDHDQRNRWGARVWFGHRGCRGFCDLAGSKGASPDRRETAMISTSSQPEARSAGAIGTASR